MYAARGLALTCYQLYADQKTGLAADNVAFNTGGKLWIEQVKKWRVAGGIRGMPGVKGKGGRGPPGTKAQGNKGEKGLDYSISYSSYLLRPEVSVLPFSVSSLSAWC